MTSHMITKMSLPPEHDNHVLRMLVVNITLLILQNNILFLIQILFSSLKLLVVNLTFLSQLYSDLEKKKRIYIYIRKNILHCQQIIKKH